MKSEKEITLEEAGYIIYINRLLTDWVLEK
jgi:hypothetical protein